MNVRELVASLGLEIDEASFERGVLAFERLHLGVKAFTVAASAAVAGALLYFTKETAEAADQAGKLAQSTGIASETLQKLGYAAELADVNTEELAVGLRHLAKTGVKDVQGAVLSLADQFQQMPDDGAKVALAMEKFGRSGAKLIPLLNGGSKAIAELMGEAEDLGLVFSEEDSKAAEEFNDDTKRLTKSLTGLRNDIGRALIPMLHKAVNGLRAFFKEFRKALPNLQQVKAALELVVTLIAGALTAALIANAVALRASIAGYIELGLAAVATGLKSAAAWALAAAPFVILTLVVAALILLFDELRVGLNGGKTVFFEYIMAFNKWLNSLAAIRTDDPWWLRALKMALATVLDLQTAWDKLTKAMDSPLFQQVKQQLAQTFVPSTIATNLGNIGGLLAPASTSNVRNVTVNSPVTINTTGGDPKEIADHVSRAMDEHMRTAARAAAAGVQ